MKAAGESESLRDQAMDWMLRLEAAPGDRTLRAAFEGWLAQSDDHRKAWRTMDHVWGRLGDLPLDATTASEPAETPRRAPLLPRGKKRSLAIAATIALAACLALVLHPLLKLRLLADHVTSVAELRDVDLDDGSIVRLDADSAIAVDYTAARRAVTLLSGQAFFEVARDTRRPFVVTADGVTVTVTGTAFDVRTWDGGVSIAVRSGSVAVSLDRGMTVVATLSRGERLAVGRADNRIDKSGIAPDDVASWRGGQLIVHDATLADMVEQLGRRQHGVIVLRDEALAHSLLSGVFDLSRPAEALNAIVQAQGGRLIRVTPYLTIISAH